MIPRIKHPGAKYNGPAVGHRSSEGRLLGCYIRFDDETFDLLRKYATTHRTSFAEQVRFFIEEGIQAVEAKKLNERKPCVPNNIRTGGYP